ncbi:secreted protein [Colletotrichum tofieldiae]|uniref:Secreted protein n=1 Tax=Colletotrichum tofieldiae TaxID=708197 RepID=A0A166MYW5_9PEZI|nr:secreted protein [Colletotrichum tofieldiae]GKT60258.1 secreted protein [Colletotrichum tofieldiae]GKT67967.1 secreted protein [Colletotrichum tofieldiae]GKT91058.1 secreted protein [Colletotrichum tofieldiae]
MMKNHSAIMLVTSALLFSGLAVADWQFRSRPDLAPPRLNITIPAAPSAVEPGYLFVAPFAGLPDTPTAQYGPRQAGPYILRDDGDLVWSGYAIYSIWATNFQAARWRGRDVLFSFEGDHNAGYGHGHGHITILDQHYETIRELRAGNHKLVDKHEFHVVNEETGLIQIYQPVPRDLTPWGAKPEQQWIVNAIIQELDIATGKLLFEWSSLDHVSPDEAILPINPGQAGSGYNSSDAWDYFHINSVDKDPAGNYLISARDACAVHKINGTDGSIIWRLAGTNSSFALGDGVDFCFQHHARWLSQDDDSDEEVISLYDNSAHGTEHDDGGEVHTAPTSSGKIIRVNTQTWKAELVQGFYPPDDLRSKSQGSTQILPGGNALVNWGSSGAVTEFTADGTPVFHAYMDSDALGVGVENYRAFRFNWTGLPSEEPAIVALENAEGTAVYVSWNGDTETRVWRFYEVSDEHGSRNFLGETERKSFETSLRVPDRRVERVVAEAVDARGSVLRGTGEARLQPEILPISAGKGRKVPHPKVSEGEPVAKVLENGKSFWEWPILQIARWRKADDL